MPGRSLFTSRRKNAPNSENSNSQAGPSTTPAEPGRLIIDPATDRNPQAGRAWSGWAARASSRAQSGVSMGQACVLRAPPLPFFPGPSWLPTSPGALPCGILGGHCPPHSIFLEPLPNKGVCKLFGKCRACGSEPGASRWRGAVMGGRTTQCKWGHGQSPPGPCSSDP